MENLEVVFISLTAVVAVCIAFLAFFKVDIEETFEEPSPKVMITDVVNEPEPVIVKPKRRYKKRKKKVVAPVAPPVVETPKKSVGRPRKQK